MNKTKKKETTRVQVDLDSLSYELLLNHKKLMHATSYAEVIRRHAFFIDTLRTKLENKEPVDIGLLIDMYFVDK